MTFYISPVFAQVESLISPDNHCFCCNKPLTKASDGPVIAYDAHPVEGKLSRVLMHRDCAFAMAQRIICDAWPNRRVGEVFMQNDR